MFNLTPEILQAIKDADFAVISGGQKGKAVVSFAHDPARNVYAFGWITGFAEVDVNNTVTFYRNDDEDAPSREWRTLIKSFPIGHTFTLTAFFQNATGKYSFTVVNQHGKIMVGIEAMRGKTTLITPEAFLAKYAHHSSNMPLPAHPDYEEIYASQKVIGWLQWV